MTRPMPTGLSTGSSASATSRSRPTNHPPRVTVDTAPSRETQIARIESALRAL
jgi:hypothetical protein